MKAPGCIVRDACANDSAALLVLMRELAVFEGYSDRFHVTEQDLLMRGLRCDSVPQFHALVAQCPDGSLLGYAVTYLVPFTFDLRPNLMLKELYVVPQARGAGVGEAIMTAVVAQARQHACARIKWDVLRDNHRAKAFYLGIGGREDRQWEGWIRDLA